MSTPKPEPDTVEPLHSILYVRYICLQSRNIEYVSDVQVEKHDVALAIRHAPQNAIGFRFIEQWEMTISADGSTVNLESGHRQYGKTRYFGAKLMTAEQIEHDLTIPAGDREKLLAQMRKEHRPVMLRCRIYNAFRTWNHDKMALV